MSEMESILREQGYVYPRKLATGEWVALIPFLSFWGLLIGVNEHGYRCGWSYAKGGAALDALLQWDGIGDDPPGKWITQWGRNSEGRAVDRSRVEAGAP